MSNKESKINNYIKIFQDNIYKELSNMDQETSIKFLNLLSIKLLNLSFKDLHE